jgi:hypothetical protein
MPTAGELISAGLSYYVNAGSSSVVSDPDLRRKAHWFLTMVAKRVWDSAPYWFKLGDSTVSLTAGVGTMPADFAQFGTQARVFVSGQRYRELMYQSPGWIKRAIETTPQTSAPFFYTLNGQTALGVAKILCYPSDNSTLDVKTYSKKMPEIIDAPLAPMLSIGDTDNPGLTGTVDGCVTFVTAAGETEGGAVSLPVTLDGTKVNWSAIPVWWGRTVTQRKLYRTAQDGTQRKLVTTLANNTDTTYAGDTIADNMLGVDVPTVAAATSGVEVFPDQFHEAALYRGLVALLAEGQADGREDKFDAKWSYNVRRMWEEYQQGLNQARAFPAYPGRVGSTHPMWSRFSPP